MKNVLLICMFALGLAACSHQHPEEATDHTAHNAPTALALNGQERWQADEATNANIAQLQELMQEHLSQPDTNSLEAVNELGHVLQLGFDEVFKECRMKGPEHDMLHVYLMPMLDDLKAIKQPDLATATAARDRMAERLALYQTYFK
ncbi:hypothetical protein H7F15_11300 [Pontibacter sp. Tf4]|uniref:hypothetical protein n=1 Tax=Pontibacter sp. Tf4 TaxID=2761620 RepID=UPI001623CEA6|nr:hypothetical protein [Pontibacter sp. Tf4]MBB6611625.1 hypothetical protein [Pontibacter sp. Tf4]